jgi:hypothetical protein
MASLYEELKLVELTGIDIRRKLCYRNSFLSQKNVNMTDQELLFRKTELQHTAIKLRMQCTHFMVFDDLYGQEILQI